MARWTSTAAVTLVLLAAGLASSAPAQTPPAKPAARNTTPYPAIVRSNFMPACMKDGAISEAQCGCIHRNIEREFTLAEYVEIDKAAAAGTDHASLPRVQQIAIACYQDPNY